MKPPTLTSVPSVREPAERELPRPAGLAMVCAPAEAQRRMQELQAFVQAAMVAGIDFGVVPGTGGKPSLFQPGAQKLAELYGFAHRFVATEAVKDWTAGFFYFEVKCILTARADGGSFVGEGVGSCNSRENRYAQRWVTAKNLPAGVDPRTLKRDTRPSKFAGGAPFDVYLVTNEDPYSLVNTIQKMACKRSYVHAVLSVTRSSGLFTQDVEDLPADVFGVVEDERPWERVGDRDAKPENIVLEAPAPPPPPPPAPVAPVEAPPAPAGRMTADELEAVKAFGPRFAAVQTDAAFADVRSAASRGRRNGTPAYHAWFRDAVQKTQARLAARPGPAKAGPPGPSAPGVAS